MVFIIEYSIIVTRDACPAYLGEWRQYPLFFCAFLKGRKVMQTPRTNKMDTAPTGKLLLSLSLPIMFSMLMQALYNIVDSIFIAHFSENALSAVSLTYPMQTLMIAISIGTYIGVNAYLGRTLGQRNMEAARSIVQHSALLAGFSYLPFLFVGLFFTRHYFMLQTADAEIIRYGVDYMSVCLVFSGQQLFEKLLEASGRSIFSMASQLIGAAVNLLLDPLLIFGFMDFPALGARGAAIATVIGQFAAMVCGFTFHQLFNKDLRLSFVHFHFDKTILSEIYKIGLPAILMQSIGSVSNFMMNGVLLTFSTTAAAVLGVYYRLQNFIFMPIWGLTSGLLPILSYNVGAKHKERVISTLRYAMLYMAVIMLAGTTLFQLIPCQLISLFDASDEMLSIGVNVLRIISTYFIVEGFCQISQTSFQAVGRGIASLICCLTRQIIVLLPAAYVLSLSRDLNYVWVAYPIAGVVSVGLCLFQWKSVLKALHT